MRNKSTVGGQYVDAFRYVPESRRIDSARLECDWPRWLGAVLNNRDGAIKPVYVTEVEGVAGRQQQREQQKYQTRRHQT
jgi:hypothetical protein